MPESRSLAIGPRRVDGAALTLFERLLGPAAPRLHAADSLRVAIADSIGELLSVRAPSEAWGKPARLRTVIDYGAAPDPALSPAREEDRRRLAAEIREAVAAFEPRLDDPTATVQPDPERPGAVLVRIEGAMRLGRRLEPFVFTAPLDAPGSPR